MINILIKHSLFKFVVSHFKRVAPIIHVNRCDVTSPGPHDQYGITFVISLQVQGALTSQEIISLPLSIALTSKNDR